VPVPFARAACCFLSASRKGNRARTRVATARDAGSIEDFRSSPEDPVTDLAFSIYLDSTLGVPTVVRPAGTTLENPWVYDSVARELKSLAERGLLEIVSEKRREGDALIDSIAFTRRR
jgi:hypothetical protein